MTSRSYLSVLLLLSVALTLPDIAKQAAVDPNNRGYFSYGLEYGYVYDGGYQVRCPSVGGYRFQGSCQDGLVCTMNAVCLNGACCVLAQPSPAVYHHHSIVHEEVTQQLIALPQTCPVASQVGPCVAGNECGYLNNAIPLQCIRGVCCLPRGGK